MRVLFSLLDAGIGGGQQVALDVAAALVVCEHEVGVLVPAPGPAVNRFEELGADVTYIDVTRLGRARNVLEAARVARRYDLVYSHTSVPGAILTSGVARLGRRPLVVHQHIYPHFSPHTFRRAVQQLLFRLFVRRATVIAVAEHVARDLVALGIPAANVTVIPNGVQVPPEPDAHASHEPVRIGLLGRLDPQKGIDTFIAASGLAGLGASASFVVGAPTGGRGSYVEAVRRAAAAAGVEIVDPGSDGRGFLHTLDIVAMPSRYEGSPLVLFEAMSFGKPVVASDIPGIREVVAPDGGVLVAADDAHALAAALVELARDDGARGRLGGRAYEIVRERYELGRMLDQVVAVLETAASPTR